VLSFLFWNLNGKPLEGSIANLASKYELDVLMLAESSIKQAVLLKSLNSGRKHKYHYAPGNCKRIQIFTRFPGKFMRARYETDKLSIRHIKLPGRTDIILAATHFISKLHYEDLDQTLEMVDYVSDIRRIEEKIGHSRTIFVGDINMNPFEDGVISAKGLNAVMSRQIAKQIERTVQGKTYRYFYNPMWNLLGDDGEGPCGTYYKYPSGHKSFFWHMFDQVLIRPELLDRFGKDDLEILQSDGITDFLSSSGVPNSDVVSAHLPIMFRINI
jgi:hypothetical protein